MKVLVFGGSGQVATSLRERANSDLLIETIGSNDLDLSQDASLIEFVRNAQADAIINAAAYTAVDKAESDVAMATALNCDAVRRLGLAAQENRIPLVHISTDYVFPGNGEKPWHPTAATGPLGVYGSSKLMGEKALAEVCENYAILRTSWVFSSHGNNFVKTMLRLGKDRDGLNVVADQIGGPTSAAEIAKATLKIAQNLQKSGAKSGVWHFSGQDDCSWADFAKEIFIQSGIDCTVNPIPTAEYPTPATRPLNSRLDCSTTLSDFGIDRPNWKENLRTVLKELGEIA